MACQTDGCAGRRLGCSRLSQRYKIAGLGASAALLVSLAVNEGYTPTAVVPVKGDVPTVGFGSTVKEDGSPVRTGDTTTPVQALQRTLAHIQKDESGIKRCVTAPLTQAEYDLLVDFSYQYGVPTLCSSSIVKLANAGDYSGSCQAYAEYRKVKTPCPPGVPGVCRRDCSIRSNGCYGVWTRQQARIAKCMGAQ